MVVGNKESRVIVELRKGEDVVRVHSSIRVRRRDPQDVGSIVCSRIVMELLNNTAVLDVVDDDDGNSSIGAFVDIETVERTLAS